MRVLGVRLLLLALPLLAGSCGERAPRPQDAQGTTRGSAAQPGAPRPPNILIVVIDTLRRDALEPGSEHGGDMPALARRARANTWLPQAASPSSWTVPALTSLVTGLAPLTHGVHDSHDVTHGSEWMDTLPELLRASHGYRSGAFFGGFSPALERMLGQGFDTVVDDFQFQQGPQALAPWLARGKAGQPWLLLLHTYEAHDPYGEANHPPTLVQGTQAEMESLLALDPQRDGAELARRSLLQAGSRALLRSVPRLAAHAEAGIRYMWQGEGGQPDPALCRELEAAYRGGVRWVDALLDRTLAWMEAAGHLQDTLWVVTADHGEAFGEHGMLAHGRRLDEELLRVPLVMGGVAPFDRPLEWGASVGLTDLLPTLLERVGAPRPARLDGTSFLPHLGTEHAGWPVLASVRRAAEHTAGLSEAECVAVRGPAWKWTATWDRTTGTLSEQCHDLRSDPEERVDLAARAGLAALPLDRATCEAIAQARTRLWARAWPGLARDPDAAGGASPGPPPPLPCNDQR